jgi:nucleoside-diphosphate-sugar epimerase
VKVLVTGSAGRLGPYVVAALRRAGHDVVELDLATGGDVREPATVHGAVSGADAVVHLAAVPWGGDDADAIATNVAGTWNLLDAASAHGVGRFVLASSVNALGVFVGRRPPDYFPIDDDHPCYATSTYGVTKQLGEELCRAATRTNGMSTVCLRLPRIVEPDGYRRADAWDAEHGAWEYGAFIDSRDAARALACAVDADVDGHVRLLVAAPDAMAVTPPLEVADRRYPEVPWRGRGDFEGEPWRALVATAPARERLGWEPLHTWSEHVDERGAPPHRDLPGRARAVADAVAGRWRRRARRDGDRTR